jgi:hypothetical protein
VGWVILDRCDAQAKRALERSHRFMRSNFPPGRSFANATDFEHTKWGPLPIPNSGAETTLQRVT